jgi:hypothetical protein
VCIQDIGIGRNIHTRAEQVATPAGVSTIGNFDPNRTQLTFASDANTTMQLVLTRSTGQTFTLTLAVSSVPLQITRDMAGDFLTGQWTATNNGLSLLYVFDSTLPYNEENYDSERKNR